MKAQALLPKPAPRDPDATLLPHNLDAERSTLGASLISQEAADYVTDKLTPDAYFRRAHQTLFDVLRELRHEGIAADFLTLKERLGKKRLDEVGGPAYLAGLTDGMPRATNVRYYCDILKDLQAKRALLQFGNRTLDLVVEGAHAAEVLIADADRRLIELQLGHVEGRLLSLKEGASALFNDLEWRIEHKGELTGVDTGFRSINELTLGWQPGESTIIAARTSIGKTTFVQATGIAAARSRRRDGSPRRVAMFSLEMRRRQLEYRMLSSLSGVPATRIASGHLAGGDYAKVAMAYELLAALPIVIDDRANQTAWDVRAACRRLKSEPEGLDLAIVDYIQQVTGSLERKGATRNDELTDISRRLKILADEIEAPVIVLSQLSRRSRDRDGKQGDKRPQLEDLRDSGAIEQDADNVAFLHRKNHRESGITEFILEKQRNGPTGTVNLTLDRDTLTFTDAEEEPSAQPTLHDRFNGHS